MHPLFWRKLGPKFVPGWGVFYYLILSYQCVLLSYPITPVCYYLILSHQCVIILSYHTSLCYYRILLYQCVLLSYPITPVSYYLILSHQCVIILSYHTSVLLSYPITPAQRLRPLLSLRAFYTPAHCTPVPCMHSQIILLSNVVEYRRLCPVHR